MITNIKELFSKRKKHLFLNLVIFFPITIVAILLSTYIYLIYDLDNKKHLIEDTLNTKMNSIFVELKSSLASIELSNHQCTEKKIQKLRIEALRSPNFKEFGLFDDDFIVYCSSAGKKDLHIFSTIVQRIIQSDSRKTVSLSSTYNNIGHSTFIAFYQGKEGLGISGLVSAEIFAADVIELLPNHPYEYTLGKLAISDNHPPEHVTMIRETNISMEDWDMNLIISLPSSLYWEHIKSLIPFSFILWLIFTFLSLSIQFAITGYRHSLTYCIREAIKRGSIDVYYQPIYSLKENRTSSLEALIRWQSPYHDQVSPQFIVDTARRLGLLNELTWLVFRKVGEFYTNNSLSLNNIRTAINIDRSTLLDKGFIYSLENMLEHYPKLQGQLTLEITESHSLSSKELPLAINTFKAIKNLDINLSIDDFGTGYSGLDFLRSFPFDTLKIDKTFMDSLYEDSFTPKIFTSIITLARELKMDVVAEGVEHKKQLEHINRLGVESAQGYFFSRALPSIQLLKWLKDNPQTLSELH
ncbi:EAL domain-containing protein [Marinomonas sp. C2222]|uniref:EAL domain-containing protein n=1 Tax=Marinomonas sargassi TaxID=2984494 RepID=A0ABT2YRU5_9GAMM|nr:EAL domain-containing protein [Marinomonas sargassi]MCV2402609.1 EAL domain-containing protein [Marinomonas sargassi]